MTQLEVAGWQAHRVEAVEKPREINFYTTPAVASCWLSHKKALNEFLLTGNSHALILEDDFDLQETLDENSFLKLMKSDLDFIQIGFLCTTKLELLYIKLENVYDLAIRFYGIFEKFVLKKKISRKLLVRERQKLPLNLIFADLRPGAHCYFLNRKAATYLISLNEPIFLSTDDLYMSVGHMRYIRTARLRRSKVGQINSESSINPR